MKLMVMLVTMLVATSGLTTAYAHKPVQKSVPVETSVPIDMDFFDGISGD